MLMLNAQFPTVDSLLASLDSKITEVQESNAAIDREQLEAHSKLSEQLQQRNTRLKTYLPGVFESDVAFNAEISKFPDSQRPYAEQARSKVQHLNKIKEFGEIVKKIDAITPRLKSATNLEEKGHFYKKICALTLQLDGELFGSAKNILLLEVEATIAPSKQQALDDLTKSLGSEWPKKNPISLEFNEALRIALLFDGSDPDRTSEAFNVLVQELDLRLKFNFESQQKTRQFDKPEWLYYFFGKLVGPHLQWLKSTVQPVLNEVYPRALAVNSFISALLPSIFRAAKLYLENCKHDHEMLSHFLEESFKFDQELVEKYYYFFSPEWLGITTTILVNDENAFQLWKQYEIDAADVTFNDLNANPGAWNIDYDSTDTKITSRPTLLGLGFSSLFDTVTDLYKNLKLARFQLIFLNEIQLPLTDRYVTFLKRQKNHPQADLDDYGKVLGSLGYLIDFLWSRGATITFIDLLDSAKYEGGLFGETIESLVALRDSCLSETISMLGRALPELFKSYVHKHEYSTEEASPLLHKPVSKLSARLDYFKNICNIVDFETIKMNLSELVANYLFKSVVQAASFTPAQGKSLRLDVDFIWTGLDLADNHQYKMLIDAADYFQTGTKPVGWSNDTFSLIEHRRR